MGPAASHRGGGDEHAACGARGCSGHPEFPLLLSPSAGCVQYSLKLTVLQQSLSTGLVGSGAAGESITAGDLPAGSRAAEGTCPSVGQSVLRRWPSEPA